MRLLISAIIIGLFKGSLYSAVALGLVAAYRVSRVVNFAEAGIATFSATLYWVTTTQWGLPAIVGLQLAIVVGAVLGGLLGFLIGLRMTNWPRGFVMIFTLACSLFMIAASDAFLPASQVRPISPFGEGTFVIGLARVSLHQVGSLLLFAAVIVVMAIALRRTRTGTAVRAIYDDPDGASTVGIPVEPIVIGVWAVSGALAGLAGPLVSHVTLLDNTVLLFVMVWALAGAIMGGLESFALALVGSLLLGVVQGVIGGVFVGRLAPGLENLVAIGLMAVMAMWVGLRRHELERLEA